MKYKPIAILIVVCCFFLFVVAFDSAEAQNINIDVGVAGATPLSTFGAASGQAGVWNTIGLGVTVNLADINGAITPVGAAVTAGTESGSASGCAGDIQALLGDNIYTNMGIWTIVLSGLENGNYTIYLYGPLNASVDTGSMIVNSMPVSNITGDSCVLQDGLTYTTVQVSVTDGTITLTGDSSVTVFGYAGLAGIQIIQASSQGNVAVPVVTSWGKIIFAVFTMLGSVYYLRRQQRIIS